MLDATDIKAHPTASSLNKGGVPPRLIGGTKGGMTSKLHGVCDSKGGPLRLHLREGQCTDFTGADVLLKDLPPAATVMEDQGYDRDKIRKMLSQQGIMPCIRLVAAARNQSITARGWTAKVTNRDAPFPTEGLAACCNPLRGLRPCLLFCHPPGQHWPLLVMSPDPNNDNHSMMVNS